MQKIIKLIKQLLHYVFQKKKRKVMVTDFIDSVLIIDDKEDEIKDLQQVLEEEDIFVQFLNPTDKKLSDLPVLKKHKQVVFIDLSLDDSINILNNVSTKIRPLLSKILPKTKGCYGLVVWSKHTEDVNILKEKLQEDKGKYTLPIFIVPFDKNEYLQKGYDEILNDLNNTLKSDKAAYFFVSWMSTVKSAANNAMSDIYSLVPEYDKQKTELMYLMYKMALNHTGIPEKQIEGYDLTTDAYKAFFRFGVSMFCGSSTITMGLDERINSIGSCPLNRSLGRLMIFSSLANESILITKISILFPVAKPRSDDILLLS
jgi:hypothetical protein